jgi:hypothetical protein
MAPPSGSVTARPLIPVTAPSVGKTNAPETTAPAQPRLRRTAPEGLSARANPSVSAGSSPPRQALSKLPQSERTVSERAVAIATPRQEASSTSGLGRELHRAHDTAAAMYQRAAHPNKSQNPEALRANMQQAHHDVSQPAADPQDRAQQQLAGHQALKEYSSHAGKKRDALVPMLRESAQGAADGVRNVLGHGQETGVAMLDDNELGQAVSGKVLDEAGEFVEEHITDPAVKAIPRRHEPVDVTLLVPDEMVSLMNDMDKKAGGAGDKGDKLRASILETQTATQEGGAQNAGPIGKAVHKLIDYGAAKLAGLGAGAAAGAAVAGAVAAAAVPEAILVGVATAAATVAAAVGINGAVGAVQGAARAMHKVFDQVEVPDLDALRTAHAEGKPLSDVPTDKLNLFYTHRAEQDAVATPEAAPSGAQPLEAPALDVPVSHATPAA